MPLIVQPTITKTVHSLINVNSVVAPTVKRTVPTDVVLLNKPMPWTPTGLFVLELELHDYPDQYFVTKLIHNLHSGCTLGYTVQRISYLANNFVSAYQQPEVINVSCNKV